jgi:hypothetical protein
VRLGERPIYSSRYRSAYAIIVCSFGPALGAFAQQLREPHQIVGEHSGTNKPFEMLDAFGDATFVPRPRINTRCGHSMPRENAPRSSLNARDRSYAPRSSARCHRVAGWRLWRRPVHTRLGFIDTHEGDDLQLSSRHRANDDKTYPDVLLRTIAVSRAAIHPVNFVVFRDHA